MSSGRGIIDENALNIFTDGSSFPNRQRAGGIGFRFVWVNEDGHEVIDDHSPPGWTSATIDEMELEACIAALKEAPRRLPDLRRFRRILLFTDSRYIVDNYDNAKYVWPKTRWKKRNGMPVSNTDLWKALMKQVGKIPMRVDLEWVKAHKGSLHNKAADALARESSTAPLNKSKRVRETTSKWSDNSTKRGCITMQGQTSKIRIISREYLKAAKTTEYRYEVIDPNDINFKALDFAVYEEALHRNKCYSARFNEDSSCPRIVEVISELDCSIYKY